MSDEVVRKKRRRKRQQDTKYTQGTDARARTHTVVAERIPGGVELVLTLLHATYRIQRHEIGALSFFFKL